MAGQSPFFLTGANAKIKLDGKTVAFATDFAYSVDVVHATPQLLGMYEAANIEPMVYKVSGSMTVIRYAANMRSFTINNDRKTPNSISANDLGNGIGAFGGKWGESVIRGTIGGSTHNGMSWHSINPSKLQNAMKFDIELYQKSFDPNEMQAFARLRDCRIVSITGSLSKRGVATEVWQFQAIYLDQDSMQAAMSGLGQQFL